MLQCYAIAETGVISYESEAREGMIVNENIIVEIVRPGTGDPVADGEVGEVVVTSFNPDYPMIRLATGDLSAVMAGRLALRPHQHAHQGLDGPRRPDHQGQGHVRASGAGRRDRQAPSRTWPRAARGQPRGRAGRDDAACRDAPAPDAGLAEAVAATLQSVTKVRGAVKLVAPGSLPNDGKVIADERPVG